MPASAAIADPVAASALRTRGLELAYNLDREQALTAFDEAIAADPTHPAAYRLAAASVWTTILFEQGAMTIEDYLGEGRTKLRPASPRPPLTAAFYKYITAALTLSEQLLRTDPNNPDARYQAGAAYACLASYKATVEGRVVDSLGPARRAYKEHLRVLSMDPRRKDAALVVGVARHTVAELSAPLRVLARLAGFDGDRKLGLRLVEEAADYSSEVQRNALFTLALLYSREARHEDALRVVRELQRRYPRNRLLWLEAANASLKAGRPGEAEATLEQGLAILARDQRPRALGEESRWRYTHGVILLALNEVDRAARTLRAALELAPHDWPRGRLHKEIGRAADLAGDRPRAISEYRQAERLCRAIGDADCMADARRLIKERQP